MGGIDRDRHDDTTLERDTANNALPQSTHATPPSSNRPEDLLAWLNGSLSLDEDTPVPHGSPQSDNRAASTDWSPVTHGAGGTGSSHHDKDSSPPTHSSRHDLAVAGQVAGGDRAEVAVGVGVGGAGRGVDGHTSYALLMAAVLTGDLEGARRILTQKVDLNLQHENNIIDHAGRTTLHLAIAEERQDVVAELVQRGADIFLPEKKIDELPDELGHRGRRHPAGAPTTHPGSCTTSCRRSRTPPHHMRAAATPLRPTPTSQREEAGRPSHRLTPMIMPLPLPPSGHHLALRCLGSNVRRFTVRMGRHLTRRVPLWVWGTG
ncbi:unnamed protein product [Vitrella brassicaformis CCMP3155]|uniref:Uncharacterized protein n=1 Tax=Vitrella brassicaformis (strain CCMP3155) TaxID=1169540 RepID=A0A0G4EIB2_VITBC|nr:unnamed protein product [Vitrella brassicaformis CCMP3155]|eukprot:CEL95743.1 unnamed protein product [Vitrella brassicaformis CCMP3155]